MITGEHYTNISYKLWIETAPHSKTYMLVAHNMTDIEQSLIAAAELKVQEQNKEKEIYITTTIETMLDVTAELLKKRSRTNSKLRKILKTGGKQSNDTRGL